MPTISELTELVEMIGDGNITVSLVALPEGLRVGASASFRGDGGSLEARVIPWSRLTRMRRLARRVVASGEEEASSKP